ncbi:MAG: universal stress protein [Candidatus Acidiferrales bacterium]
MVQFKRILCPVDYSEPSRYAFQHALALARQFSAELTVLHVVEDTPLFQAYDGVPDIGLPQEIERAAHEGMEKLLAAEDLTGANVKSDVVHGPSYRTIVEYAKQYGADLIVMATHGRGALELAFFGSVAERVVKSAGCPVMVVPLPGEKAKGKSKK